MRRKGIIFLIGLAVFSGCQIIDTLNYKNPDVSSNGEIPVTLFAEQNATKVTGTPKMGGMDFSWEEHDVLGVYVFGKQNNRLFSCVDPEQGYFRGTLDSGHATDEHAQCRAYYPFVSIPNPESGILRATLPDEQHYPYDNTADFIVSDLVTDYSYDEEHLSPLTFAMRKHLFCIAKIQLSNTNEALADEPISYVRLETEEADGFLAGDFTFDLSDGSAEAAFTEDVQKQVTVSMKGANVRLGLNETHIIYLVVRPCTILSGKLKLTVFTDNYVLSGYYDSDITFNGSKIKVLPAIALGATTNERAVVVLWGDSITFESNYLQSMREALEPEWKVFSSGVGGDNSRNITARQGANQLYVRSAVTIPKNASDKVPIVIYATRDESETELGKDGLRTTWFTPSYNAHANFNPVTIGGVSCTITWDGEKTYYVNRNQDAESTTAIEAGTPVYTYAQSTLRDCDLMIIYMGTNGGHLVKDSEGRSAQKDINGNWIYTDGMDYSALVKQHKSMLDYSTSHKAIILGFHFSPTLVRQAPTWCPDYVEQMTEAFSGPYTTASGESGVAAFIDLRTVAHDNFVRLLIATGVLPPGSTLENAKDFDKQEYAKGNWPYSFDTSVHPNLQGDQAIAILVREKIDELKAAGLL